ncbi:MAG: DUF3341 domain-containing protein [Phycisphaerales bacterium]
MSKAKKYKTESGERIYGIVAEFANPAALSHAAEKVRDGGYRRWDVYSPFPVHGMDEAMGLKRTRLPLLVALCAFGAAGLGYLFQWYVSHELYPLTVQGKPYGAWEPFTPIIFEFGVLGTAFSALLGMLIFNALPRFNHPLLKKERFLRASDDRFFICIEASDAKFEPGNLRSLFQHSGATYIDLVAE